MSNKKKNTIQVFEHQKLRIEQGKMFQKKHFDALVKYNEKHDNKYFQVGHKSITFNEYVGVIRASGLTIEILPKADRGNDYGKWQAILLYMLKQCRMIQTESVSSASLKLRSNSLLDLYFEIFVSEIEYLLHTGLVKQYRKLSNNLTALKGALHFPKHISKNLIHKERFYTNHTIYDEVHLLHEIIYKTLKVLYKINNSSVLKNRIVRLLIDFPEMKDIKVTDKTFEKITYSRKTQGYKNAINIAQLILLNYSPDIVSGRNDVLAILFDMNKLWEEFVLVKLKRYAKSNPVIKVYGQKSKQFWHGRHLRPDIVIKKDDETFIIDTKWKKLTHAKPSTEDLRQIFAYNEYWKATKGMLLYPQVNDVNELEGDYLEKEHSCRIGFIKIEQNIGFAEEIIGKLKIEPIKIEELR